MYRNNLHYVFIKDILNRQKGIYITAQQMKELDSINGDIRVFAGGNTTANIEREKISLDSIIRKPSIIVKSRGNIDFEYYDRPFTHKNELWSYSTSSDNVNLKYIYYNFKENKCSFVKKAKANSVKLPQLTVGDTDNYSIPLPHIKVQEEIVEILDSFTNLIDALNEELSLRKKQFEYYREKLITAKCYISVMKPICELAEDIFSGATPSTKIEKYWTNGDIPWMSSGDIHQKTINDISTFITKKGYDSCSTKMVPIQSIVIALAGQGKTRGTVGITNTALCTNQSLCAIVPNKNEIIPKFLFYYLDKEYDNLRRISSGDGTRGGLNLQMIRNYIIEYPSLDIQQSIVEKLDAFESLISSLKEEIALRQKQYEYYREKLLTFN